MSRQQHITKGRSEATPKDITCETPSAQTDAHYENSTERPSVNPHAVYWSVLHHKNVSEPSNGSTKNMFSHTDRKQTDHAKPINLLDESHIDTPYGSLDSDLNDNVDTHEHPTPNQDHLDTIPSQSAIADQVAVSFTPSSLQDDGSIPKVVLHERQGLLKEMSTQSALSGYGSTSPSMSPSTSLHYPSDVKAAPQQMQQELTFDGNVDQDIKKENSRWNRIREMVITDELFIHNIPEMDCENVNGSNSIRHNYLGSVVSEHQSNRPLNGKASFLASFRSPQTSSVRSAKKWSDLNDLPNEFTLRECFFLFLILLVIGVIAYSFLFEKWPIIDSIYFTIVCLTTVGYGDRTPSTPEGKLFAALFALGGVVVLGLALGIVGSRLVEAEIRYTEKMKAKTSKALESAFTMGSGHKKEKKKQYTESKKPLLLESQHSSNSLSSLESVDSMCSTESMHSFAAYSKDRSLKDFLLAKENESLWGKLRSEFVQGFGAIQRHVPGFVPMLVGALIMAWLEKWKWYDAVYYCVVTATVSKNLVLSSLYWMQDAGPFATQMNPDHPNVRIPSFTS